MSVSKEKAFFFLSGNRNKTIKQMLLKDATPEKLLRRFQEFGLAAEPDMLEEVESHMTVFHPGDSKTVFEDLESDGVYEIPFHGNAKAPENKEAACGQPRETLAPSITRPPDILDEDIHRALICCAAVYGPDEELVRSHFDENRQVHNFERFSLSRYGKVRYFIAVRQGSKGNRTEVFISFRGTDNFDEILADMQEVSLCSDFEGKIHAGFYELAATIPVTCILQKYQNAKIVVCGHSLGGAVAKIVALHMLIQLKESKTIVKANPQSPREDAPMPLSCITFGAPYVADRGVSEYIEKYGMTNCFLNVINQNDPVPYVVCLAQASHKNKPASKPHSSGVKRALSPILNLSTVSSGARTANLGDGIADDLAETNKLLQSTQRSEEVYCALGWYLFYTHSESSDPAWNAEFVFDQTMVNRKLSRIGKVTGETIELHTMKNYDLAISHDKSVQQPNYNPTGKQIGLTNDFPLKVKRVGLQMEQDTSPGINQLNVTIKGENLSFFTLDGSEFTGVPKTLGEIEVYECSKNRVGMMFLVDSESYFDSNLRFKICGHFNEDKTTVSNREIQKIKSMTPAELLYKDMNPKMLHKAFERGITEMAMQPTQEKRDHEQAENPFLKNLYKLEMTADSKYEGSFASCQLFEIAGTAAGKGKMCMSKADSEKAQQVMKTIVEKMNSPLKIQVEWKWYEYITAAVLGLAGVAAITATGGGAAIVIGGACANLGLTVGISGSIGTIATGALNYLYYRKANYEDNYKLILRTCIEELPDLTDQEMNKLVKGGADSQHVITLEETLLRKCYNLDYMYQDRKRSSLEWRDIDGILGSLPFENSTKFRRATKDSQKLIFQHIQMCINLYELRQKLIESCFVCIAGLQDSGKSTLIKQVWGQDVQDIGFQIHTKEAVLHRITSKMTVIDFPGTSDLEQDVADTLATCGTVASFFVYVMPFSGDPSQIHVKEMQGIVPFNCPVLVCINQCSRYLDAFKDKAETEAFEKKYHDVILKTFKEKAETAEDIPEFKLMFTDFLVFDEEMEKRGLKGTDHVRAQIKEWLKKFGVYGECEDLEIAAGIGQKAEETQGAVGFDATPTEEELELVSGISDCKLAEPVQEVGDSSFDIPIDEKLK